MMSDMPLALADLDQICDELKRREYDFALAVQYPRQYGDEHGTSRIYTAHNGMLTALGLAKMHVDTLSRWYQHDYGVDEDDA